MFIDVRCRNAMREKVLRSVVGDPWGPATRRGQAGRVDTVAELVDKGSRRATGRPRDGDRPATTARLESAKEGLA
ncbi:hypothetical protein CCR97_13955 [Rhodoplanes elegans]|uniref:Uncharacterized protein n=1 Tax=Rhodoplanes elegans TaxID=29408 RepID=A0A327KS94_9BRAD|nr:hypothetical protein [Rhodoplanes elegans]RAI40235.1 hypothetical protein CH338_06895 [Rhodoplanes elegans]